MQFGRRGGILLHPTSLPGKFGIGDMGSEAYRFIDWLAAANCRLWQVLPLNPPGYGNSPYACLSAFAGNPLLISPEQLASVGLLEASDLAYPFPSSNRVNFGEVYTWKRDVLRKAFQRARSNVRYWHSVEQYLDLEKEWLQPWAVFIACKQANGSQHWRDWQIAGDPSNLIDVVKRLPEQCRELYEQSIWEQYLFDQQWLALRAYANERDILLLGDLPLFVADDSADTWYHRELFMYDANGHAEKVAGVPPDYFSETGQLWGNPQYDWSAHQAQNFAWWISRIKRVLTHCDIVRIDHFRGLAASWHITAGSETAMLGEWVSAPGAELLQAVEESLGSIPLIAEDLGLITPDVVALRDQYNLPGMKILQFAFDGDGHHTFLPHNYQPNCVVYSGTHDNNTTWGWYRNDASEVEKDRLRRYIQKDDLDIPWDFIRLAWRSVAEFAIVPLQDVLMLDSGHRMNLPGSDNGNWRWRFNSDQLTDGYAEGLKELTELCGRNRDTTPPAPVPDKYPMHR